MDAANETVDKNDDFESEATTNELVDADNDFSGPEEITRPIPVRTLAEVSGRWRAAQVAAEPVLETDELLLAARGAPTRDLTLRAAREKATVQIECVQEYVRANAGAR